MWNLAPRFSTMSRHLPTVALSLVLVGSTLTSPQTSAQPGTPTTEPAAPAHDTAAPVPPTEPKPAPSIEDALTATGLPADLDTLTQAELVAIVKDLALQHAEQAKASDSRPHPDASRDGASTPGASPDSRLAALEAQVKLLTSQLRIAQARIAALKHSPPESPESPEASAPPVSAPPADTAADQPADNTNEPAADNTVTRTRAGNNTVEGAYLYRYEYGLIEAGSKERRVLRDREGNVTGTEFSDTNYRKDAVWVRVIFQNRADRPLRYTGLAALGRKTSPFSRPEVLTTLSFSTHVLQPGEVYEFEREVNVDNPFQVDFIEVGRVLAIAPGEGE